MNNQTIKNWALRIFELARAFILLVMVFYLFYLFILTIFFVSGPSMEPNFKDKEILLINKTAYWFNEPQRKDVIVFFFPGEKKSKYIKRIIGMPGETIELKDNGFYSNGKKIYEPYIPITTKTLEIVKGKNKWVLGADEYFVVGDNRSNSNDSRVWGALPKKEIIGKVWLRLLPFSEFGEI